MFARYCSLKGFCQDTNNVILGIFLGHRDFWVLSHRDSLKKIRLRQISCFMTYWFHEKIRKNLWTKLWDLSLWIEGQTNGWIKPNSFDTSTSMSVQKYKCKNTTKSNWKGYLMNFSNSEDHLNMAWVQQITWLNMRLFFFSF